MKKEIFNNAIYYYYSGLVINEGETKDQIFFEVDGEHLEFTYGRGFLEIYCTCEYCSRKPVHKIKKEGNTIYYFAQLLCSRKIACILYIISKCRQNQNI